MTDIIDKCYFAQLAASKPESLCKKDNCNFNADSGLYTVELWGDQYLIDPTEMTMDHVIATGSQPHKYFDLLSIYYLLQEKDISLQNEWVSEKDFPGGPAFYRGPHQIPTNLICRSFENELEKFQARCEELNGAPMEMADAAYSFSITPDIPVAVLYWIGDEDFPADAKLLYDRSITNLLSLDIIFALAVGVCDRIGSIT